MTDERFEFRGIEKDGAIEYKAIYRSTRDSRKILVSQDRIFNPNMALENRAGAYHALSQANAELNKQRQEAEIERMVAELNGGKK